MLPVVGALSGPPGLSDAVSLVTVRDPDSLGPPARREEPVATTPRRPAVHTGEATVELFVLYLISFVVGVVCAFCCAKLALGKGRNAAVWGVLGFLFSIVALIVIALLPSTGREPIG